MIDLDKILNDALTKEVQSRATNGIAAATDSKGNFQSLAFGEAFKVGDMQQPRVFRIASMSKSFLAAEAHLLHEVGTLNLHDPVSEWLPDARLTWQGRLAKVTLADLLANRSGLPEDNAWADRNLGMTRDDFGTMLTDGLELAAWPGAMYQYSNIGQAIVGAAIEEATGSTVAELVRDDFLKPLGLTSTAYTPEELSHCTIVPGMRTFDDGKTFTEEPFVGDGALSCIGGMYSDAIDMTVWAQHLHAGFGYGYGKFNAPDLAPVERKAMQSPHTSIPLTAEQHERLDSFAYGHGLMVEQHKKFGRIVQHSGGLPGFSSHMRWHVATGTTVIVFGNSDSFGASVRATEILDRMLEEADIGADFLPAWPSAISAAAQADEVIQGGDFAGLAAFAADNVLRDVPAEVRARRLDELLEKAGPVLPEQLNFMERMRPRANAAEVQWTIACASGELTCTARMTPHAKPLLQQLTIT